VLAYRPEASDARRVADLAPADETPAVSLARALTRRCGMQADAGGRFRLPDGRTFTADQLIRAGLTPDAAWLLGPGTAQVAAAAVLDGTATDADVRFAIACGWDRTTVNPPALRRQGHGWYGSTPDEVLASMLGVLAALRPFAGEDLDWLRWRGTLRMPPRLGEMARQAVDRLGDDAAGWVRDWGAQGGDVRDRRAYLSWICHHARPWRNARPAGRDPDGWRAEAAAWTAAGYPAREAIRLARLPDGDPRRPSREAVETLAALR
jgi:hypothetical protein